MYYLTYSGVGGWVYFIYSSRTFFILSVVSLGWYLYVSCVCLYVCSVFGLWLYSFTGLAFAGVGSYSSGLLVFFLVYAVLSMLLLGQGSLYGIWPWAPV